MFEFANWMRRERLGLVFLAAMILIVVTAAAAHAAPIQTPLPTSVLCPTCYVSLTVTETTANVALPAATTPYGTLTIYNEGDNAAFIAQGDVSVEATLSSIKVPAGAHMTFWASGTHIAAIAAETETATLDIYQSNGPIDFGVPYRVAP